MRRAFPGGRRWPAGFFHYHKRIEPLPAPASLSVPLWNGGRAEVQPGDRVARHALIGHDRDGLPVHAPLGGRVREVGDFPHLAARPKRFDFPRTTVFIEADRRQAEAGPAYLPLPRFWELTHQELCRRLLEAGVMDVCHRDLPRAVIFNGLDLEPPLSANLRLIEERTAEALEGMRILSQLHGAVHARIVLATGFPGLEARLRALLASSVNLSLHMVEPVYPQDSGELLRREVFPDERCTVYGMADVLRASEAVVLGRPVTESHLTARNDMSGRAWNLTAPIGTPAGHVLWPEGGGAGPWREHEGTRTGEQSAVSVPDATAALCLVLGGLMSGRAYYSLEMPVQADTRGVLLLDQKRPGPSACINCGACHLRCPVGLHPSEIHRQVTRLDSRRLEALSLGKCLGCGLCGWVCPSKLELPQQIEVGRRLLEARQT